MRHLLFLIFTYAYLEIPGYSGVTALDEIEQSVDQSQTSLNIDPAHSVNKRGVPYKRLPAWSIYYGKRSSLAERSVGDQFQDAPGTGQGMPGDDGADDSQVTDIIDEISKRPSFKRLHSWLTTYGKRDGGEDFDNLNENNDWVTRITEGSESESDENMLHEVNDKRVPGWSATYGKRVPGWSATYGKRVPGWSATYGKRAPGWSATYGKRVPGWSATYGKRVPGWSATYGKRVPGWSATYGKRVPGWSATYGKRVPGWSATYGKRVPGWSATYGKRVPGWAATYGKRDNSENNTDAQQDTISEQNVMEDVQGLDKRRQWAAIYGR